MDTIKRRRSTVLFRNWWVLLLRGLVAIAFGVMVWVQPGISLVILVLLFGADTMADGILAIWAAIARRNEHESWWTLLLEGLLGIVLCGLASVVFGILLIAQQDAGALTVLWPLGGYAVVF